ncbi:multidrug efflux pump subunit AcrA (membrane-fusion protein) [Acetoanaerobium pronyense]|uniref:Multidrug efflux pump subunit AcrA (Membrane-fusion protein) n=1 Tax=Acetoanaerobium pronyense TaxID=1482736 RepID=A0ABS4KKI5_9FIRM|nr:biotin/lipoyl-binding protein [Acetoanaerobium pronyense]MBP2028265.1 multidrug efflux pump subunit AcrA (membrane-fusion protein) [Acetoanaerobium pronyense]
MKKIIFILALIISMIFTACTQAPEDSLEESIKPVITKEIEIQTIENTIKYSGIVTVSDTKNFAFKTGGKINSISVEKGDRVSPGKVLATLDTTDLNFALQAASAQLEGARAQYDKAVNGATREELEQLEINLKKAQDAYEYTEDLYQRMEKLYEAGATAENDLNKLRLEKDIRENEMRQSEIALRQAQTGTRSEDIRAAQSNVSLAQSDYNFRQNQINSSSIVSDMNGYVVEVLNKSGDFVSEGYPVVVIRGESQIITTGISRQDMDKVSLGTSLYVLDGEDKYRGRITYISDIPDSYTRTYEAEIALDEGALPLGSIVDIRIITGQDTGIWIPISAMMSDGEDYVYINQDDIALRKEIEILSTNGSNVKILGINEGEKLIIEGMRNINPGDKITER